MARGDRHNFTGPAVAGVTHATDAPGGPAMPSYRNQPVDVVLDVRSHLEFLLGHLPGATCVPVGVLERDIAAQPGVTTDSRILVYCASGIRSANAADILRGMGYAHVIDAGGLSDAREGFAAD